MTAACQDTAIFPTLPVALGDYTLIRLLGSHESSDFYLARQSHVERRVVMEVLRPAEESREQTASFLAKARTLGAVRLPFTAAVLESASPPEGYTYICHEAPVGTALSILAEEKKQLNARQACALISAAGKFYTSCEEAGLAAAPLTADMVFLSNTDTFCFLSPVQPSLPAEGDSARQLQGLATAIISVQPLNVPGQGRIATLLSWMLDGYEGEALDWPAVVNTAELIAEQLQPASRLQVNRPERYDRARVQRAGKRRQRQTKRSIRLISGTILFILAMGAGGYVLAPGAPPPLPPLRGGYVHCKEGDKLVRVPARLVSIADYREFLDTYPALESSRRGSITLDVPPAESSPIPADWEKQLRSGRMDAPVTNVSYWQALMYARYHRSTLPTASLLAAARAEAGAPGLEEWTRDEFPAVLPYSKSRIVLPAEAGASPLPENNAASHNPQRGFRICR